MNIKLATQWVAVLVLGSVAWVAFGLGHSPFDFVGMMAGAVCALFILDCVEKTTGRTVNIYRFGFVAVGIIAILGLVRVPEIASTPIALILAWNFEDFALRYSAARAIRKIKEKEGYPPGGNDAA
jgi:hypothetical protein